MGLTITPLVWDAKAATLTPGATVSTVPAGVSGKQYSTAEIVAHPSGKFIYGSNRGHNSIAVFKITDPAKGGLSLVEIEPSGGKTPRNFNVTPDGKWLLAAHESSDNITVFSINQDDGSLTPTPHSAKVGKAVCLVFMP
jgi:6-phosphogluconolactonase